MRVNKRQGSENGKLELHEKRLIYINLKLRGIDGKKRSTDSFVRLLRIDSAESTLDIPMTER